MAEPSAKKVVEPFNIHLDAFWEDDLKKVERMIRKLDEETLKKLYGMTINITDEPFFPHPKTGEPMVGDTRFSIGKPYLIILGKDPTPRILYHEVAHAIGIEDETEAMNFAKEKEQFLKRGNPEEVPAVPEVASELDRAAVDLFIERHGREAYEGGEIGETLERINQGAEEYDPAFLSKHPELKGESITVYHDPLRGEDLAVVNARTGEVVEVLSGELKEKLAQPPAVEVAIEHRGTEPEGIAIADELGIRYDGIQKEIGMQFTDIRGTGSTFYATSMEDAREELRKKRRLFGMAEGGNPIEYWRDFTELSKSDQQRIAESMRPKPYTDWFWQTDSKGRLLLNKQGRPAISRHKSAAAYQKRLLGESNPTGKVITEEEAIGLLERLSMTPGEAARSLVADEAERREIMQTVQQRVKGEQKKWAPMDPREGPPLPRIFAGLKWPWKK